MTKLEELEKELAECCGKNCYCHSPLKMAREAVTELRRQDSKIEAMQAVLAVVSVKAGLSDDEVIGLLEKSEARILAGIPAVSPVTH